MAIKKRSGKILSRHLTELTENDAEYILERVSEELMESRRALFIENSELKEKCRMLESEVADLKTQINQEG